MSASKCPPRRAKRDPAGGPLAGAAVAASDTAIADLITALGVDPTDLNASSTGDFVGDAEGLATAVLAVESIVAQIYGLDAQTIASYGTPVAN